MYPLRLLVIGLTVLMTQEDSAGDRAGNILDLLREERFSEVVAVFNPQMAAALPVDRLSQAWSAMRAQAGNFQSVIDRQTATSGALTVVTIGCQFEGAALNVVVALDQENRVAGLNFSPRQQEVVHTPPPASASFIEEPLTVGRGEWALPGTLTLPRAGVRVPVAILVHGSGPQDRDETIGPNKPFRDLAWGLAEHGIASLRYEKRTRQHGSKLAQNTDLTIREEAVDDAILAVSAMRSHPRIDPARIVIIGHSLGGTLAPMITRDEPSVAALVIMAGATRPLPELMIEQIEYLDSVSPSPQRPDIAALKAQASKAMDPALRPDTPASEVLGVPAPYWIALNAYNPVSTAAALSVPILILQGERDYQVTMKDLDGWRAGLGSKDNVGIKTYADLNHLFMPGSGRSTRAEYLTAGEVAIQVVDDIAAWINTIEGR